MNHSPDGNNDDKHYQAPRPSTWTLVKEFCDYTSCNGLNRVAGSRFASLRVIWFLLVSVALGVGIYQLNGLFLKFRSRPVSTTVKIKNQARVEFPMITICNHNLILKSQMSNLPNKTREMLQLFTNPDKTFTEIHNDYLKQTTNHTKIPVPSPGGHGIDEDILDPNDLKAEYKIREEMYMRLAEVSVALLRPLGHQFEKSFMSCTFKGIDCKNFTAPHWSSFWHYKFGNCFVYNSGKSNVKILKSSKAGPLHGLQVDLFVDQKNYVDQVSQEAGYRILIGPQGPMPFPYEQGISVSPGFSTSIGMRKVAIRRADPFHNNSCMATETLENQNLYAKYNVTYSSTACWKSCLAHNQLSACGCIEYRLSTEKYSNICAILDRSLVRCLRKIQRKLNNNDLNCSTACPPRCRDQYFRTKSSQAIWPSKNYEAYIKKEFHLQNGEELRRELLRVKIFYEVLNYEEMVESANYNLIDFLSDIGGQLGLWLGVSVLTAAEILELLVVVTYNALNHQKKSSVKQHGNDRMAMEPHGETTSAASTP